MKISTRARYALRLMIDLADNDAEHVPVTLGDVARRQQISKRYLEQLAMSLRNANLVSTAQGRGGGYSLARPPDQIRMTDIIAATIGRINVVQCVMDPDTCKRADGCPSRRMWDRVNDSINEVFNSTTLLDLCEDRGNPAAGPPHGGSLCTPSTAAGDAT